MNPAREQCDAELIEADALPLGLVGKLLVQADREAQEKLAGGFHAANSITGGIDKGSIARNTKDMSTATTTKTICTRCGGDGRYHAPTSLPGGCFACDGRGYFIVDSRTVARREARERKAEAQAADYRAISEKVTDALLDAWGDEFAHIDEAYRHMHVTQKAERILFRDHGIRIKGTWDIADHLELLVVA